MTHAATIRFAAFITLIATVSVGTLAQPTSVVQGPHNLSVTSPGQIRATSESKVCIFCHTTHSSTQIKPLWNREFSTDVYNIYTSRSLDAVPGQPTGSSKMCLSCHDGTIALGAVVSRTLPININTPNDLLPIGPSNLGTDLSDDHPISFPYDSSLIGLDSRLKDPLSLPPEIPLDHNNELQCSTCHDAHDNTNTMFLRISNINSDLCLSCHQLQNTLIVGHNNCVECHQTHSSPSGPYLLREQTVTATCTRCHNPSHATAPDIESQLTKPFIHDTGSPVDPPAPFNEHATCTDCHEPHTIAPGAGVAPSIHPNFGLVDGVSLAGSPLLNATTEYEVCFRCHANQSAIQPVVSRVITQNDTSLEFNPNAISFHPVATQGRNPDVPSLNPSFTTSSIIYCSDCHGNDEPDSALTPQGIHGSNNPTILRDRYEVTDFTTESSVAYALCYKCHDRNSILGDQTFSEHSKHIVNERTPCSACHDSHGIAANQGNITNNSHLINFDRTIVQPNSSGLLKFEDLGNRTGQCSLSCHGKDHKPKKYP